MTPGVRLRPAPTPAELADMYPAPHQHAHFGAGHDLRVRVSTAVGRWLAVDCDAATVADLQPAPDQPSTSTEGWHQSADGIRWAVT